MKLIFVYNADGSFGAKLRDVVKKVAAPNAQECNLCAITYPLFAMNREWSEFTKSLPHQVLFLHRDEFHSQYSNQKEVFLPAVFTEENGSIRMLISREEINNVHTVSDLIALVKKTLAHVS